TSTLAPLRRPPSLPTRRSSDLHDIAGVGGRLLVRGRQTLAEVAHLFKTAVIVQFEGDGAFLHRLYQGGRRGIAGQSGGKVCAVRSEEHTSELQSRFDLVCRLLL